MHHPSVAKLLDLGNRMLTSLESGDVDAFSDLLEQRGRLVRTVASDFQSEGLSEAALMALGQQSRSLEEAMRETRTGLGAAVSAVSRFRTARGMYRKRPGKPDSRLNKSLHG